MAGLLAHFHRNIQNVYMQYFIGYSGFSYQPVFDPSLFVDLRKRFGADQINEINEAIMGLVSDGVKDKKEDSPPACNDMSDVFALVGLHL